MTEGISYEIFVRGHGAEEWRFWHRVEDETQALALRDSIEVSSLESRLFKVVQLHADEVYEMQSAAYELPEAGERNETRVTGEREGERRCRICGCSEFNACHDAVRGACYLVGGSVCSHCVSAGASA